MQYNKGNAGTAPEAQTSVARSNLSNFQNADATSVDLWSDRYKQRCDCGISNCRESKNTEQIGRLCLGASCCKRHAKAMTWRWKVLFTPPRRSKITPFYLLDARFRKRWISSCACFFQFDYPSEPSTRSPHVTLIPKAVCIDVASFDTPSLT